MSLGHSKMTYLRCPSDPDDDRRGLVLIRLELLQCVPIEALDAQTRTCATMATPIPCGKGIPIGTQSPKKAISTDFKRHGV